jgi:hypothetical protein
MELEQFPDNSSKSGPQFAVAFQELIPDNWTKVMPFY